MSYRLQDIPAYEAIIQVPSPFSTLPVHLSLPLSLTQRYSPTTLSLSLSLAMTQGLLEGINMAGGIEHMFEMLEEHEEAILHGQLADGDAADGGAGDGGDAADRPRSGLRMRASVARVVQVQSPPFP